MTWAQIGLHSKPVYLVNVVGYWQPLLALIDNVIDQGFADASLLDLFQTVPDVTSLAEAIRVAISRIPANTGSGANWNNSRTGSAGTITALAVGQGGLNAACRAFATTINDSRGIRRYRGEACLRRDGNWQLFGVTADDTKLL